MGNSGDKAKTQMAMIEGVDKRAPRFFTDVREMYATDNQDHIQLTLTDEGTNNKKKIDLLNEELDEMFKYRIQDKTFLNKYDHYLSLLVLNDIDYFDYANFCAFYIQGKWKKFTFIKKYKLKSKKQFIDLVIKGNENNNKIQTIINYFTFNQLPFRIFDIKQNYPKLKEYLIKEGFKEILSNEEPLIFISNFYIGSSKEFIQLKNDNVIGRILRQDYEFSCLNCNLPKNYNDDYKNYKENKGKYDLKLAYLCPNCKTKYFYFSLFGEKEFDIFANRK